MTPEDLGKLHHSNFTDLLLKIIKKVSFQPTYIEQLFNAMLACLQWASNARHPLLEICSKPVITLNIFLDAQEVPSW